MKKLLEDKCYGDIVAVAGTMEGSNYKEMPLPPLPVTKELSVCYLYDERVSVKVKALLDTGNDITLIKRETLERLKKALDFDIPQFRTILFAGKNGKRSEPVFKLALVFPEGHIYSSEYGFISPAPENWDFEDMDVWVGQDIFNQLLVTFDGPGRKVTVFAPNK